MISVPVDYGMTAEQTLAHRIGASLPDDFPAQFDAHWTAFREAVASLPARWHGAIDGPVNQVTIRSLDSVRVAARVTIPETPVRGVVVTTHGYANIADVFGDEPEPWTEHGLATVRLRVRGYPPSTFDTPDLRGAWIMHRLSPHAPQAWIVRGAVGDVVQAIRCARTHFGESLPLALHGESLGGGLATIAAAQLTLMDHPPDRLILALPTFGDWRWRDLKYCNGSGGQVNMLLDALRGDDRERLLRSLMLYDSALHAKTIKTTPVLCKLALSDDTVPAPSAAAVFNAIASPRKWRFLMRYGHFDGGIADARRHALFERLHPVFADPAASPEEAIAPHLDSLETTGLSAATAVAASAPP